MKLTRNVGLLAMSLITPVTLYAHVFTITPTVPFASQVYVSSVSSAIFTLTNVASQLSFTPVDESVFPAGSGLSITSNTCGSLLAPGQSCVINVQLVAPATPQLIRAAVREWAKPSADGVQSPFSINVAALPASFFVVAGGDTVLTADSKNYPLIGVSQDGGANWSQQAFAQPSGFAVSGFADTSCSGSFCAAVGYGLVSSINHPIVGISNNSGSTWQVNGLPLISTMSADSLFGVSCSSSTNCVAVGQGTYAPGFANLHTTVSKGPSIAVTTNGGTSWTQQILTSPSGYNLGSLSGVSCIGNSCVAAGTYVNSSSGHDLPLIGVSNDNGTTWSQNILALSSSFTNGVLNGIYCNGASCNAVGYYTPAPGFSRVAPITQLPVVLTSSDRTNWTSQVISMPNGYNKGVLNGVTCSNGHCVAVGFFRQGSNPTVAGVATSADNGATWTSQAFSQLSNNLSDSSSLQKVQCVGSNCIATGYAIDYSFGTRYPLVAVSNDFGATWALQDLPLLSGYRAAEFVPAVFN